MSGEFNLEKEIRMDEARIARYFNQLPSYLDLPGENEAVFAGMARAAGEKVQSVCKEEDLRRMTPGWEIDLDNYDIERYENIHFHPEEYEMLSMLDSLAVNYSRCFALENDAGAAKIYVAILCQCGKTLARISDMLYTAADEVDMRAALAKRALRDVSDMSVMLEQLQSVSNKKSIEHELDILQVIRKKILDIIFKNH